MSLCLNYPYVSAGYNVLCGEFTYVLWQVTAGDALRKSFTRQPGVLIEGLATRSCAGVLVGRGSAKRPKLAHVGIMDKRTGKFEIGGDLPLQQLRSLLGGTTRTALVFQ